MSKEIDGHSVIGKRIQKGKGYEGGFKKGSPVVFSD